MTPRPREVEGTDLGRIVAFTDGVFAIAITLLVLNFDLPDLSGDKSLGRHLVEQWPEFLAYFLSFAVVGRFWIVHHRVFAGMGSFDGRLIQLNLLYLALVVLVPFTTELIGEYGDTPAAAVAYATVVGVAALVNWLMIRHILEAGHVKDEHRQSTEPFAGRAALINPGVFVASIPVALLSPYAAEAMWVVLGLIWPIRRQRLLR